MLEQWQLLGEARVGLGFVGKADSNIRPRKYSNIRILLLRPIRVRDIVTSDALLLHIITMPLSNGP